MLGLMLTRSQQAGKMLLNLFQDDSPFPSMFHVLRMKKHRTKLDDPIVDGDFFPHIIADLFVVTSISMQGGAPVR